MAQPTDRACSHRSTSCRKKAQSMRNATRTDRRPAVASCVH